VRAAIQEAGIDPSRIDRAIMVGGSSRIPSVIAGLKDILGIDPDLSIDPDLCVAMGAAIQAGIMEGEILDKILVDITAHSLGVKALDGLAPWMGNEIFSVIIPKNTPIPVKKAEVYYTVGDNQKEVDVEVFQGESRNCDENTLIGEFLFELRPSPRHSEIVVEFSYDLDGIVHVTVDQKGYNNKKEVSLAVRGRGAGRQGAEAGRQDYLQKKAKKLLAMLGQETSDQDAGIASLSSQLEGALKAYSMAKDQGTDNEELEELEEILLDAMEEIEDRLNL
jgi:molecular chaperone DnaK